MIMEHLGFHFVVTIGQYRIRWGVSVDEGP
jgi:predicted transcriptional regulator